MTHELWDTETQNTVGAYENEAAALAVVREAVRLHGAQYAETLALVCEDNRGRVTTLAIGNKVAKRAAVVGPAGTMRHA